MLRDAIRVELAKCVGVTDDERMRTGCIIDHLLDECGENATPAECMTVIAELGFAVLIISEASIKMEENCHLQAEAEASSPTLSASVGNDLATIVQSPYGPSPSHPGLGSGYPEVHPTVLD